jgi:hypothetical protein
MLRLGKKALARAKGRLTISGTAKTQKGGIMSSRKFSYWSSPKMTTKSGAKASSALRTARKPSTSRRRCSVAAAAP